MEDKRTRSDYIREIKQLEKVNKHYEKIHKELIKFIEDEIEKTDDRIKQGYDFLGKTKGSYDLERNLKYYKKGLVKIYKKINELERLK